MLNAVFTYQAFGQNTPDSPLNIFLKNKKKTNDPKTKPDAVPAKAEVSTQKSPTEKKTVRACQLSIKQAPTLRGLKIGMTYDETAKLFPTQFKLMRDALPPILGYWTININQEYSKQFKDSPAIDFTGISHGRLQFMDDVLFSVQLSYTDVNYEGREEELRAKLVDLLNLPDVAWYGDKMLCSGFFVQVKPYPFKILIENSSLYEKKSEKIRAEENKRRDVFKP